MDGIIWIVVFAALVSPPSGEYTFEHLNYLKSPNAEICEGLKPYYMKAAIAREEVVAIGVTTDCFPYNGTLEQYKKEQTNLLTFD